LLNAEPTAGIIKEKLGTPEAASLLAKVTEKIVEWKHENGVSQSTKTKVEPTPPQLQNESGFTYADEIKNMDFKEFREVFEQRYFDPEAVLWGVVRSIAWEDWDDEMLEVNYNVVRSVCLDAARTKGKCGLCGEERYRTETLAISNDDYTPEIVCANPNTVCRGCGYVFAPTRLTLAQSPSDEEKWTLRDLTLKREIAEQGRRIRDLIALKQRNSYKRTWRQKHPLTPERKKRKVDQQRQRRQRNKGLWSSRTTQ
jgi:hypothetical protein